MGLELPYPNKTAHLKSYDTQEQQLAASPTIDERT
jgi:hypothetical protein